jgi:hypothetical protein
MAELAQKYQDELPRIKRNIENSYSWFKENYDRFNAFRKYIFKEQLDENYLNVLRTLNKPQLEFNILEAYISRLKGEFSKQEPSTVVSADHGAPVDARTIKAVEDHFRFILEEAKKSNTIYQNYDDTLSGGFSVLKVWTDYIHEMSFDQCIKLSRVYHPALCGFDPLAKDPHKGDGRFCFEIFPREEMEFKHDNPNITLDNVKFTRSTDNYTGIGGVGGFQWSYQNQKEKILLLVDYYEKKKKRVKIVKTADSPILGKGRVMTMDGYKKMVDAWDNIVPAPAIVGQPRWSTITTICRYKLIEDQIVSYEETDYSKLPLIFVDGNSEVMQDATSGKISQITRPYIFHAKGMQDLKNYAGNAQASELENIIQHKFMIAEEAIPEADDYRNAYKDIQNASLLVYKAYSDKEQMKPLPPPQVVARQMIPPQISETFMMAEKTIQNQLGSYDAALGINDNQLSGVAIVEAATQSNAAAMPYIVNVMTALSRAFEIILDLIPKYYVTPRTIPIFTRDGKRAYQIINDQQNPESVNMKYDDNVLTVRVEAGLNFAIQKHRALQQIIGLSSSMPIFGQFMNTAGLQVLLNNLEIKDIDILKDLAAKYQQELEQQKQIAQQQQQQAMQNDPRVMKEHNARIKLQLEDKIESDKVAVQSGELAISEQKLEIERLKILAQIEESKRAAIVNIDKHMAEKERAMVDLAIKKLQTHHTLHMDHGKHEREERRLKRQENQQDESKEIDENYI